MTDQKILDYIKQHPSGKVKLAVADMDGVLRGKYISVDKFCSVLDGSMGFCDVVFGWDMEDAAYDNTRYTGWHTGYPDAGMRLDPGTFRKIPWEQDVPFMLGEFIDGDGGPLAICPRQLLRRVLGEAERMGYAPVFAQEFEWFNFAETPDSLHGKGFQQPQPLTPGMFGYSILRTTLKNDYIRHLFEWLKAFDVPLEGLHTETGPGVYEAAIAHTDILTAADRAVLFKTAVKEIAYQHGVMATFMAKWHESLPGCGGHVHQSLWDAQGQENLFYDAGDPLHMSMLFKQYVAGQLYCLPHLLPLFAPTVNSYKRLVEGAWAPTTLTWSVDNRTVALRVLPHGKKSARLETRVIGSDTNPYLALAGSLAAGLYGIKHQLSLDQPATVGNGYQDFAHGTLPRNLYEATQQMKASAIAKELLGETFVEHFSQSREWEWKQYAKAVTDWELKRYFEII
ncbi:glutamine synthetase family protein [Chitinophaga pendula]|uniref:glutamine synthetase family protein n=1 Tax=Chitinophaga TaxID=79328 RepID=UPI000BB065B2|nr:MULTISPECIES: glutamine synthetase family protein [Chitinophaga]ASZ12649.1 glutamine synthetase [Chitinophaga sp. MD30]UCJ09740.1 glutamine synthetase family protein [Chitinophaga pendula]